jgi:hypothetical protein
MPIESLLFQQQSEIRRQKSRYPSEGDGARSGASNFADDLFR